MRQATTEISRYTYPRYLKKRGWKHLGSGSYSSVYAKPGSDRCIKIGAQDDWPDFIKWGIERGYCGTFMPKVFALKHFNARTDTRFYIASVERCIGALGGYGEKFTASQDQLELHETLVATISGYNRTNNYPSAPCPAEWKAFIDDLQKFPNSSLRIDLKGANWLARTDGSICLNDPACGNGHWFGRIRDGKIIDETPEPAYDATATIAAMEQALCLD